MATLVLPSKSDLHPFHMNDDVLQALQSAAPAHLQLLRLRLRFGLPRRVQPGQTFRVVVDLVDEMGQPPSPMLLFEEDLDVCLALEGVAAQRSFKHDDNQVDLASRVRLEVEQRSIASCRPQSRTKWIFHAAVHAPTALDGTAVCLAVCVKQSRPRRVLSSFQHSLQQFCVASAWLGNHVLVLPLQVQLTLHATDESPHASLDTSTACQRVFCVSPSLTADQDDDRSLVVVEENYGDAMGAHVWDASVLLSFAFLQAGVTPPASRVGTEQSQLTTLELGAGCGLFVSVLQAVAAFRSLSKTQLVATERPESTQRLQDNLQRNAAQCKSCMATEVLALEWGAPLPNTLLDKELCVVFAADVLYNWAAHDALLATLDALVAMQKGDVQVILAHKRRGKASAEAFEALAAGAFDSATHCRADKAGDCKWSHWRVRKISSLGAVAFYRLTPHK